MKKFIVVLVVLALLVGCTRYASQEQLDELEAREGAVESLKTQVKDTQKEKGDLMGEIEMKEDELEECEEKIAEIEKKIK